MATSAVTQAVRRYYEQNTRLFMALGTEARTAAIHRAVWAEGVTSLEAALNTSNQLLLDEINALSLVRPQVIDLGCGVGGTVLYLQERLPAGARVVGLTISPLQARLAQRHAARAHLPGHFVEADFLAVPLGGGFDVAYSVEAFCHAADAARYFEQVARLLRPGGRWLVCDDVRAARSFTADEAHWLEAYQAGWHVPNLQTLAVIETLARAAGLRLIRHRHLTPHLRLRALPNPLARALWELGRRLPLCHAILPSMLGSMALQQCLRLGVVEYRFLVFEKHSGTNAAN